MRTKCMNTHYVYDYNKTIANQLTFLFGPGFDSISPALIKSSSSHEIFTISLNMERKKKYKLSNLIFNSYYFIG